MSWSICGISVDDEHISGLRRTDSNVLSIPARFDIRLGDEIYIDGSTYKVDNIVIDKRGERQELFFSETEEATGLMIELVLEEASEDEQVTRRNATATRKRKLPSEAQSGHPDSD